MALPQPNTTERFTWHEYREWPGDERWQIIDGQAYAMTPAPNIRHQKITGNHYASIREQLRGKACTPFIAPTDVVFDDCNIVQPDVLVVCDRAKITDANIQGAPDLVIEVLSPSSSYLDRKLKLELYERFGVTECILIEPSGDLAERFRLVDGCYRRGEVFPWHGELPLISLPGVVINLWDVFERDLAELNVVKEGPKNAYRF